MVRHLAAAAVIVASISAGASASTIGITEGTRDTVDGTFKISGPDSSPLPGGAYDLDSLGTLGADSFEIYGRIVDSIDNFAFGFSATSAFNVSWIFGGYTTGSGAVTVTDSGFVKEGSANKTATFTLLQDLGGGIFNAVGGPVDYTTNVTSGPELIFSAGPGDYVVQVDGSGSNASGSGVGLYDISISAVPLPAGGWLLIAGVGGLAALRRKRK